jgi:asperthecin polyketide synthase
MIGKLRLSLERHSFKCTLLELPYAFHTAQMDVILEDLGKIASGIHFKAPSVPVISPIMGGVIFDGKTANAEYLKRHTRETVNFAAAIDAAHDMGIVDEKTMWVDIGPHPICTAFVRSLIPEARVAASCRRNEDNLTTIAKSLIALHLAGVPVKWNEFYKPDEASLSLLTLPKYSWNNTNYWIPYIGTWTLDKAKLKYGEPEKPMEKQNAAVSTFRTSLIHTVVEENVAAEGVYMRAISDMQQGEFFESIWGHQMNGCGVATSVSVELRKSRGALLTIFFGSPSGLTWSCLPASISTSSWSLLQKTFTCGSKTLRSCMRRSLPRLPAPLNCWSWKPSSMLLLAP